MKYPLQIHLGYQVGTGNEVKIPLKHMAIAGQTQESGKTTTLEALIARSGLRALTFITKRGEGSFRQARRLDPYFREQADWQFVASILEASRGEKMRFERAWIIRASKGARTLADVHRNVQAAMEKAKGMSADVYLTLDAYLEAVVPQINKVKWATDIKLAAGVNVMDLTDLNTEMQHLVIKSSIDWVLQKEENTVVVIPEAWKFIPQGRGTPVKLSAEAYIRQAAGLKNYLWLDSQDIGGIEKTILRSIPVWILGVQREANEIKRTLDNIPASIASRPSKSDIATQTIGQFYACWGNHSIHTYVQPVWMNPIDAMAVAKGRANPTPPPSPPKEKTVTQREADDLRKENSELKQQIDHLKRRLDAINVVPPTPEPASVELASLPSDYEAMYQQFKQRLVSEIPCIREGWTVHVTPPEKLRKDFQKEEAERLLGDVKALRSLPIRVLALLEGMEGGLISQTNVALRLGRSTGGGAWTDLTKAVKELSNMGLVLVQDRQGMRSCLREKIASDLSNYKATETEINAVYQTILHHLATTSDN